MHPPLFNLRRKIFFTDCVDEDYWDEDNSHTASSRNFLFPRSPSSLALCLFIVLNLDSFHEIFLRGARIRRRVTFDTHEIKKWINTNKNTTMIHTLANLFHECENTQRTQVAQAPVVRWSSCTITVMAAGGIIRPLLGIKQYAKNTSPYLHSVSLVTWLFTLMKRTHFSFSYVRWKPRIGQLAKMGTFHQRKRSDNKWYAVEVRWGIFIENLTYCFIP